MMNPTRREILNALEQVSAHAPDVRFGQLIANLAFLADGSGPESIWQLEDEELLTALRHHLADLEKREPQPARA